MALNSFVSFWTSLNKKFNTIYKDKVWENVVCNSGLQSPKKSFSITIPLSPIHLHKVWSFIISNSFQGCGTNHSEWVEKPASLDVMLGYGWAGWWAIIAEWTSSVKIYESVVVNNCTYGLNQITIPTGLRVC